MSIRKKELQKLFDNPSQYQLSILTNYSKIRYIRQIKNNIATVELIKYNKPLTKTYVQLVDMSLNELWDLIKKLDYTNHRLCEVIERTNTLMPKIKTISILKNAKKYTTETNLRLKKNYSIELINDYIDLLKIEKTNVDFNFIKEELLINYTKFTKLLNLILNRKHNLEHLFFMV